MTINIKPFLLVSSLFLSAQASVQGSEQIDPKTLQFLANQFNVKHEVLTDFVNSYDFKCPKVLSGQDLVSELSKEEEETELSVMLESDKLGWRDTYVEARSNIECIHTGMVSAPF